MIPWWWSVLLTGIGLIGLYAAGSKKSWGWLVGLGAQVLWISYAIATEQWGFILSALVYRGMYIRNYRAWKKS